MTGADDCPSCGHGAIIHWEGQSPHCRRVDALTPAGRGVPCRCDGGYGEPFASEVAAAAVRQAQWEASIVCEVRPDTVVTGLWCERCSLPSRVAGVEDVFGGDGPARRRLFDQTFAYCADCGDGL